MSTMNKVLKKNVVFDQKKQTSIKSIKAKQRGIHFHIISLDMLMVLISFFTILKVPRIFARKYTPSSIANRSFVCL